MEVEKVKELIRLAEEWESFADMEGYEYKEAKQLWSEYVKEREKLERR